MKKIVLSFLIIISTCLRVLSQTPTVQDCAGAIPICQNVYHETNSYVGMGNYLNEVNSITSCLAGNESNSVWYTFTAQTSGNFSFVITPNNTSGFGDDYDWSVFDLTNAQCSDIYSNPSIEVSCNSWGADLFGFNGPTGASTAHGGYGNHNGPGTTNGPEFNADIPVTAGNIYVMIISNFTGSTYGYTIDFSSSTATIFDNVPPSIHQITSNYSCGASSLTFDFSENILCNTIAACDLSITGPGGPYTINSITGANCNLGGTEEKTFTITFSPAITSTGTYNLNLNASSCNSVTDLCGNVAPSGSLPFDVNATITTDITTTDATCGNNNGSATITATVGSGTYSYLWSTVPPQTTSTATNLAAGNYTVTIYDGICTAITTVTVSNSNGPTASISNFNNATCGMSNGSATVSASGGSGTYSYLWSTTPAQTTSTATNLAAGNYTVTVNDGTCTDIASVTISNSTGPSVNISNFINSTCGMPNGSATVTVVGGSGSYSYLWNTVPPQTTATAINLAAGNYSVTVNDGPCSAIASVTISDAGAPSVSILNVIDESCGQGNGSATVSDPGCMGTSSSFLWSTIPAQTSQTAINLAAGTYTVTVSCSGCISTASTVINNISAPTVTASSTNEICGFSNGTVTANPIGTCSQNFSYQWNTLPVLTSQTVTNLPAGTYIVTVSCNGCVATASTAITNIEGPSVSISNIIGATCNNANGSATALATGGTSPYNYSWNCSPQQNTPNMINVIAGSYTVTVTDSNGCMATDTVLISGTQSPAATTSATDEICGQANGTATVVASGGSGTYIYLWSTTPPQTSATISGLSAGSYLVTVNDGICSIIANAQINNIPGPDASFSAHPKILTTIDGNVYFNDNSSGNIVNWQWDFGDGTPNGSGEELYHDFENIGTYSVTLIVTDNNGCIDSVSDTIKVKDIFTIYIPNAFSPDGDDYDDYFYPKGINWDPDHFEMYIFNRWGNLVYETKTIGDKWNGTFNNDGSQDDDTIIDTYIYLIRVKEMDGAAHEYIGKITLLR